MLRVLASVACDCTAMNICNYFCVSNKFFTIKRQAYPLPCSPLVSVWSLNSSLLLTTCLPCRLSPGPLSPAMAKENWWRWFSIIQLVLRTKGLYFLERHRKHMSCKLKCGITEAINNQEHLNSLQGFYQICRASNICLSSMTTYLSAWRNRGRQWRSPRIAGR